MKKLKHLYWDILDFLEDKGYNWFRLFLLLDGIIFLLILLIVVL